MPKFRKKPVAIEATTMEGEWPAWFQDAIRHGTIYERADGMWAIKTLEGDMQIGEGDWIIRGIKGELYPCKPDIFEATYEPVE